MDEKTNIIATKEKIYSIGDIKKELQSMGIENGDDICVHSQIFSFGKPLLKKDEFCKAIIELLIDMVGTDGTVIMPTFTYSFCRNEIFDVNNSESTVGVLTEEFRKYPGVQRTEHPIFSFAVYGKRKKEYLDIGPDAFGLDSVYGKLMANNGKIIMFGANKGYTSVYLAEEHVRVSYRYFKVFSGEVITEKGNKYSTTVPYFVRYLDKDSEFSEDKMALFLVDNGVQVEKKIANGNVSIFKMNSMYEKVVEQLNQCESYFI